LTRPLLVVDGDSLAHRAYHGLPKQIRRAEGRPGNALVGFSNFLELAQVLTDPPPCAQTAKLRELLLAVPRIGPARVHRALAHCRIAYAKTVAGLSDRQRGELIELLGH
jgi:hypothetical protein